ncbi:MAG: prephenate dehydrogenase/arogenate dehydrogenase family protein [Micromonosporaceae bacterium]|nr:prephenate dehydrogenase/arogenate dehydrogenase family protein [Micromonosporaceae bacterium]
MLTVSVLGLGLIGGSLLRALARAGYPTCGYDADPATRAAAREAASDAPTGKVAWRVADSVADAAADTDLAVLAVPLPAASAVLDELAHAGFTGIVSDVTSVKGPVAELVAAHLPDARHIGGHPMAGKEVSGFAASDPTLFTDRVWALCLPEPGRRSEPAGDAVPLDDWLTVAETVTALGARVTPVTAAEHDTAVATISHLPHLAACAIAAAGGSGLPGTLAAGSFRDGTRVAASPPALVAAMCGGNAPALVPALDDMIAALAEARARLTSPDPIAAVRNWLVPGHTARSNWPPTAGPTTELPATADHLLALGRAGGWLTAVARNRHTVTAIRPA